MLSSFRGFCFLPSSQPSSLHPSFPFLSFPFCLSFVVIYINPFVIGQQYFKWQSFYSCFSSFSLLMADFTMMAEVLQVSRYHLLLLFSYRNHSAISPQLVSYLGFAKGACVLGMLADFNFLHYFPEGGTIMGSVYTNSDILGAYSHVTSRSKPREEVYCFFLPSASCHQQLEIQALDCLCSSR